MGRTLGAKNKPKEGEEGFDYDNTVIDGGTQQKKTKETPIQKQIIADKLNVICEVFASLMGKEYNLTEADFKKESIALGSLARDNKMIAKILEFLDPIVLVCGIYVKFKNMKNKPKAQQEKKQQTTIEVKPEPIQQPTNNDRASGNVFSMIR